MNTATGPSKKHVSLPIWRRAILAAFRTRAIWTEQAARLREGPCIVVCNHGSMLDGPLLALSSPIPMTYAVTPAYAIQNPWTRRGLAALSRMGLGRVIPLSQTHSLALRGLCAALQRGESVMIFPTGQIAPGPELAGYQWLHRKTGAPVYRVQISGADRSRLFADGGTRLWPEITVTI